MKKRRGSFLPSKQPYFPGVAWSQNAVPSAPLNLVHHTSQEVNLIKLLLIFY